MEKRELSSSPAPWKNRQSVLVSVWEADFSRFYMFSCTSTWFFKGLSYLVNTSPQLPWKNSLFGWWLAREIEEVFLFMPFLFPTIAMATKPPLGPSTHHFCTDTAWGKFPLFPPHSSSIYNPPFVSIIFHFIQILQKSAGQSIVLSSAVSHFHGYFFLHACSHFSPIFRLEPKAKWTLGNLMKMCTNLVSFKMF